MARVIALLVWFIVVFFFYFKQRDSLFEYLSFLIQHHGTLSLQYAYLLKALGALAIAIWIAWVTVKCGGQLLAKMIPVPSIPRLERLVFSAGLGFGLISILTFGLGVLHLWYVSVFWGVMALLTAVYFPRTRWKIDIPEVKNLASSQVPKDWTGVALCLLAAAGLIFLISGLSPEVFYDSLHYHLAVPNLYLVSHHIENQPHVALSSFAMSVDMFWGFALTVGNEITAKLLHISFAVLLLFAFIAFERRYLARGAGLLGGLLFVSMPLVGTTATSAGIDVALSALQFLAVFALCRALIDAADEAAARQWIRLAGVLTGLAASTKYTGLPAIPIACLLILMMSETRVRKRQLEAFLIPAALMVVPYLARNVIFHHNPVYPLAATWWGEPRMSAEIWQNFARDAQVRSLSAVFTSVQSFLQFLFHPWFITMNGVTGNMDFVGPLLLGLLPILLVKRPRNKASRFLGRYSLGLWAVWLLTASAPRFGISFLAMVSLLLAHALLNASGGSLARNAVLTLCMAGAATNLYFTYLYNANSENWRVLAGQIPEHEYLSEHHPTYPAPGYEALDWMNRNLPAGSRILMAGDARTYFTRLPVVASSIYDSQVINEIARKAHDGPGMARLLREQGFTHVFVNFGEAVRTESYGVFSWDPQSWSVLEDFWPRYVKLVWVKYRPDPNDLAGLFVFKLLSDQEASELQPSPPPNPFERWKPK